MKSGEFFKVNVKLLRFKAHYFVFYGALSGVFPFVPVFAKQLGIHAAAFGLIYSILPFCSFISKPFFGFLADYFQNIKVFLVTLIILISVTLMSLLLIPPIEDGSRDTSRVKLELKKHGFEMSSENDRNASCINMGSKSAMTCDLYSGQWNESEWQQLPCRTLLKWSRDCTTQQSSDDTVKVLVELNPEINSPKPISNKTLTLSFLDEKLSDFNNSCNFYVKDNDLLKCTIENNTCSDTNSLSSVYDTYQFWLLVVLLLIPGSSAAACMSLADAACCETLGAKRELYGKQRLWGTISWGAFCALTGFLNDTFSTDKKNFSPGFYLMFVLLVIDAILIVNIELTKSKLSSNVCKDIRSIIKSSEIMTFASGVFVIGILTSIVATYEFWFLEDMGASQSLLGLAVAMQCLVGEVPLLFSSGWFIKKLGYFPCIVISFSGFALRLGLYSVIKNPWLVLPIDALHGFTFAIFHATLTFFASAKAPAGLEATVLGFLGGLSDGLGNGTGSFLGGLGFKMLGSRLTFFSASVISLSCIPVFLIAPRILKKVSTKEYVTSQDENADETHDLKHVT
ncbi:major facilitator superfamily domain-containing protein 6-like [Uloborus diversus]|uniref:major facilitator superfamily domain-containing protein 6-like n=1 Tax=Uloborus diversus TaxID=327109 RepID=UPI00240A9662|nr:major facilitator superfamily domain-containing protein 6-like [Uloborus diversus]XP_054723040.1 major facilitator superfamily domain-containing protein 6-like [Uloborus diversus]